MSAKYLHVNHLDFSHDGQLLAISYEENKKIELKK